MKNRLNSYSYVRMISHFYFNFAKLSTFFAILALTALLPACGGGGGGDDFVGAGNVSIRVSPGTIDVGDRLQVTIEVTEVNEDGVILKFQYPRGLSYVPNSAFLIVDGEELDVGPTINQSIDDETFLVFFFSNEIFGDNDRGDLEFQLRGDDEADGEIGVDIDVDNPLVGNDIEFQITAPEFQAEDKVTVEVSV